VIAADQLERPPGGPDRELGAIRRDEDLRHASIVAP